MINPGTRDLPSSGTIKLSEVKDEFGKGNSLLGYLGEGGVTSSAPLKLTDFYGTAASDAVPSENFGDGYLQDVPLRKVIMRHSQHGADQVRMVAVQREAMVQEAKAESLDPAGARQMPLQGSLKLTHNSAQCSGSVGCDRRQRLSGQA